MASIAPRREEILLPVRAAFIVGTIVAGLLLNLLPWEGTARLLRPDFVAVIMLYWCIHQPRRVGIGAAWLLGLLMDVAQGTLFGQHAMGYAAMAFVALVVHRRVHMFAVAEQILHVLPMLLLPQVIVLLIGLAAHAPFPGWLYFGASISGALLWPPLSLLLQLARRTKPDPDKG